MKTRPNALARLQAATYAAGPLIPAQPTPPPPPKPQRLAITPREPRLTPVGPGPETPVVQPATQSAPPDPEWLSFDQVASRLNVHKRTVRRMVDRGEFPKGRYFTRTARRWSRAEVDAWAKSRSTEVSR